jgi:hypothetical protein
MTNKTNTHIPCKTLERTPFNRHIVLDVARVGENGIVARKATAFEFLWRIIVDTERAFFIPACTGIGRSLTFIDVIFAVTSAEAVGAFLIAATER